MKIDYRETSSDLLKRIDIHQKYGGRDIDAWMLQVLDLQPGTRILDVACGAGKQCFVFWDHLHGKADITGGDVSEELLATARTAAHSREGEGLTSSLQTPSASLHASRLPRQSPT